MYRKLKIGLVTPAYNEEKLIGKTIALVPDFVDDIIVINDCSTDKTANTVKNIAEKNKRVTLISNERNCGMGYSVVSGYKLALEKDLDVIGLIAGDAQCDTSYLSNMIDTLIDGNLDYVKANRFMHHEALRAMPPFRRLGNTIITILTKFATGYYSIFDSQNGYGVFKRQTLEEIPFETIGQRYDYENTLLVALSIIDARVKDCPVPAIYGDETSTIKFWPVAMRALRVVTAGFWKRIYLKYVVYNFHPIALFLFSGLALSLIGFIVGLLITINRFAAGISPTTGTVMLSILPLLVGFQLVLTAVILDINNERK